MALFPGKFLYLGLLLLAVIDLFWVYASGHSLDPYSFGKFIILSVILFCIAAAAQSVVMKQVDGEYIHRSEFLDKWRERIMAFLGGILFISIGWVFLRLFNHLSMTIDIDYADDFLIAADAFFGFNWNAYFDLVASSPLAVVVLDLSYTSLTLLSMVAFVGLILTNRLENARFFVLSFVVTALVCTVIGMFFPANAAVHELLIDQSLIGNFPYPPGLYSVEIIANLKSGNPQIFNFDYLPGLTTFPSFHTAAGIVLAYAYRGNPLFWLVFAYTVIMIASTPVYGGHYFVDIIAGTVVALAVCAWLERLERFRGIFTSTPEATPITAPGTHATR